MAIISQDDILIRVRVSGEDAYPRLDQQSRKLGKSTQTLGGRMAELGNIVTGIESGFALAARAAATAKRAFDAVSAPVGLAIDFEQQFAQVKTLTDQAGKDLERGLLDLAERVPQTAGDITQAAYQAISAGIDPTEAVQFLDAASKTAVAGATSLTTAVDLLTSAANAYKVQGIDAARASDVLFATVRQGKTTVDELAQSIGQAAPAAAQFGVRIEELGAAAAVLTKQGLSTAEAMTRINALTKAIVNPSQAAAKKLRALGVEFGATALKSKGLTAILQDLRAKTEGNDEALATLFQRFEATQAVVGLLGDGLKGYATDLKVITDSAGQTSRANAIMADTVQGAIDRFNALKEGVLREVGQELLPVFNAGLSELAAWVDENRDEIVAFARDFAEGLIAIGKWAAEDGPALLKVFGSAFVASKITAASIALAGFKTELLAIGPAAAGAGGGVGKLLGAALRSPGVVGLAVGGAVFLGQAIGDAIGENMTAEFRAEADRLEVEMRDRAAKLRGLLRAQGVKSVGEFQDRQAAIRSGDLLPSDIGAVGDLGRVSNVKGARTFAETVAALGQDQAAQFAEEVAARFGQGAGDLRARADYQLNQVQALRDEYVALGGAQAEAAAETATMWTESERAIAANAKRAREVRLELQKLEGAAAEDAARAAELERGAARLRGLAASAPAQATPPPPLTPPKPPKPPRGPRAPQAAEQPLIGGLFGAAGGIGGGVSDLLAAGAAGGRGLFDAIESAERANAERRALLIEDQTQRELALAQLRYEQEVALAESAGQDVNLVTQLYARERQRILQDAADMERQSWQMAASEAIGSVESILGSFEAMAGGSKALRAIIMSARGTDYQMKAVGLAADAIAAGAIGNIPGVIQFTAAAAAAEAAAIQHFAKAAGLGGGGGGGARSAGAGGGAARTAGVGGTPRARASDGFSSNGGGPATVTFNINGPVVGSRNALTEFARDELVPAINTALGRRGGVRLDLGRR